MVGLPLHNIHIPSPFTSIMDVFFALDVLLVYSNVKRVICSNQIVQINVWGEQVQDASCVIIYYRFIVHFPIWLDFLFITFTFLLHLLLSWTSSLSISSSAISASTLSNHVFLGLPTSLLPSTLTLHTFLRPVLITFSHHMSISSQSTTYNESCDRLNSNQPPQSFMCPVF